MDKLLKNIDIACAALFGTLGIVALVAGFCGKTHQFTMAAICAAMVAGAIIEIRSEERKTGAKPNHRAKAITRQLFAAITRRAYPTAHIPMQYWSWRWDRRGNVQYRHWCTLWWFVTGQKRGLCRP